MKAIRLNPLQIATMRRLRPLIAERGYYIGGVAKSRYEHPMEFIACHQKSPQHFVWVRPKRSGIIELRPFCERSTYVGIDTAVEFAKRREHAPIEWSQTIEPLRSHLELKHFLTLASFKELETLTAAIA
jgi:hypothetical protein